MLPSLCHVVVTPIHNNDPDYSGDYNAPDPCAQYEYFLFTYVYT